MFAKFLHSLSPRSLPWITRQSYAHELVAVVTIPVAIALVEGGVIGVLAVKAFGVSPLVYGILSAAPMFANLTSFIWAKLARGRGKIRSITVLQLSTLASIAAIAFLPTQHPSGPWLLVGLMVLSRCLLTGVVTLRSTVWRNNYPRTVRASITGRLALLNSLILAGIPLLGYALLDQRPELFRVLYPASTLIALIGVVAFSRVRLRGEKEILRLERSEDARPQPHGVPSPIYEYARIPQKTDFWSVLRRDRLFRNYMVLQFTAGGANMMSETVIVYIIAREFGSYTVSILLSTAIPMLVATLTLPMWARQLDKVHIVKFRSKQGTIWIADQLANFFILFTGLLPLLYVARVIQGAVRGGGMLAWNLGHNDFADRHMVAVYMGIHVTLTGVRGAIVPLLGMALYEGWPAGEGGFFGLHWPGWAGIGVWVFMVTAVVSAASEVGFIVMGRQLANQSRGKAPVD